jgi:hypothetical protein
MPESDRPTTDPGPVDKCPVCGGAPRRRFPGCYWRRFGGGWVCVTDNPLLGRGA